MNTTTTTAEPKKRQSTAGIRLPSQTKAIQVYPRPETVPNIKTIGFRISANEAKDLALLLLAGAKNWSTIDVTCFRETNSITVTSL
jgi:hypothetical protein